MKTAREVLQRIDAAIQEMQAQAAGPCIDALISWADRDAYREAMRRAYGLKAVQALRDKLAPDVEDELEAVPASLEPKRTRGRGRTA